MPHGRPKSKFNLRLDPDLVARVLERSDNLTAALEDGLRLWLKRPRPPVSDRPNPWRRPKPGDGDP